MAASLKPQQPKSSKGEWWHKWWYYETRAFIDLYVDVEQVGLMQIRIPASMLRKSLERMFRK
jgi:hypothetical protein